MTENILTTARRMTEAEKARLVADAPPPEDMVPLKIAPSHALLSPRGPVSMSYPDLRTDSGGRPVSTQETDPDDFPFTPRANVLRGRNVEPFVPTPPPRLIISITCLRCSEMPSRESFIYGMT